MSRSELKNTTEMRSTEEGPRSRSKGAEERGSDLGDGTVGGTQTEEQMDRRIQKPQGYVRNAHGTTARTLTLALWASQKGKRRERAEDVFDEVIAETPPPGERNRHPGPGGTESPKQDEAKDPHQDTRKLKRQRSRIKKHLQCTSRRGDSSGPREPHKAVS